MENVITLFNQERDDHTQNPFFTLPMELHKAFAIRMLKEICPHLNFLNDDILFVKLKEYESAYNKMRNLRPVKVLICEKAYDEYIERLGKVLRSVKKSEMAVKSSMEKLLLQKDIVYKKSLRDTIAKNMACIDVRFLMKTLLKELSRKR